MSKEEEEKSCENQLRHRNREAAARYRNKKQNQLLELKEEAEDWKRKCGYLTKNIDFLEKSKFAYKDDNLPSLIASADISEEQIPPEETSKVKVINKPKSKYRNRYEPGEQMSKEQEKKWVNGQRKQRNRKSAARSRIKKQEELVKLEKKVKMLKGEHDLLMKRKNDLEKESALSSKCRNNLSYISTSGSEKHDSVQSFATNTSCIQHGCPSPKSGLDYGANADEQYGGDYNMKVDFLKSKTWSSYEMELLNDSKIYSFAIGDEDSIPMCSKMHNLDPPSCTNSRNVQLLVTTEQQMQQDTSSARMKHDNPIQVQSLDNRTEQQCDTDFDMNMTQLRKRGTETLYNGSSFKKMKSTNFEDQS
jgi:hypothetical protein